MEAIYTPTVFADSGRGRTRLRSIVKTVSTVVADVLADGVRGHDFERAFTSAPGAQFAALPRSSKQRLLDRGFRP